MKYGIAAYLDPRELNSLMQQREDEDQIQQDRFPEKKPADEHSRLSLHIQLDNACSTYACVLFRDCLSIPGAIC